MHCVFKYIVGKSTVHFLRLLATIPRIKAKCTVCCNKSDTPIHSWMYWMVYGCLAQCVFFSHSFHLSFAVNSVAIAVSPENGRKIESNGCTIDSKVILMTWKMYNIGQINCNTNWTTFFSRTDIEEKLRDLRFSVRQLSFRFILFHLFGDCLLSERKGYAVTCTFLERDTSKTVVKSCVGSFSKGYGYKKVSNFIGNKRTMTFSLRNQCRKMQSRSMFGLCRIENCLL